MSIGTNSRGKKVKLQCEYEKVVKKVVTK